MRIRLKSLLQWGQVVDWTDQTSKYVRVLTNTCHRLRWCFGHQWMFQSKSTPDSLKARIVYNSKQCSVVQRWCAYRCESKFHKLSELLSQAFSFTVTSRYAGNPVSHSPAVTWESQSVKARIQKRVARCTGRSKPSSWCLQIPKHPFREWKLVSSRRIDIGVKSPIMQVNNIFRTSVQSIQSVV